MIAKLLKRPLIGLLRPPVIGYPAAWTCRVIGATGLCRKISQLCRYCPKRVDIEIPTGEGFRMLSADGRDLVARSIWFGGWRGFEPPMPDLFAALARNARTVYDVGASSGLYSLIASAVNPRASVVAFEPLPAARRWLTANIAINGLEDRVRVVPAAASDRAGTADLFVPSSRHGWVETSASLNESFHAEAPEQAIPVDVVTLDAIRADTGASTVDLMKVDAEGLEHRVLAGARRVLAEDRPIVFVEVLPHYVRDPDSGVVRQQAASRPEIDAIRSECGYLDAVLRRDDIEWRDHVEGLPGDHNHVLCPEERRDRLEEVVRSMGYMVGRE